jgi:hypothetical protein
MLCHSFYRVLHSIQLLCFLYNSLELFRAFFPAQVGIKEEQA